MIRRSMLARLKAAAHPDCPECGGDGVVSIVWNNNPDREEDIACDCTRDAIEREDGPPDDPDAWSGGFARNH